VRRLLTLTFAVLACAAALGVWEARIDGSWPHSPSTTERSHSRQTLDTHQPEQSNTQWRDAALHTAVGPTLAALPALDSGASTVVISRTVGQNRSASNRPHDPPHLHTFVLLI
jgi:hypothetical protein